jgi:vacuolar protein sorting-associated protein 13A/C
MCPSQSKKASSPLSAAHLPGYLGKLHLHLPWTNLANESAVVRISDVFLVVKAVADQTQDREKVLAKELKAKMMQLALAKLAGIDMPVEHEAPKAKTAEQGHYFNAIRLTSSEWIEGIGLKIADNVQVFVDNVHIRYEDDVSNPEHPYAVGLIISDVHVESTDENWRPNFNAARREFMHKVSPFLSIIYYLSFSTFETSAFTLISTQNYLITRMSRDFVNR